MQAKVKIFREFDEVNSRLEQLGLHREHLIAAGQRAVDAYWDTSALQPAPAPSTQAYFSGVEGIREGHIGPNWSIYKEGGLEGIVNDDLKMIVLFQNVDAACQTSHPKARSAKGANSEKLCGLSLFERYEVEAPQYVKTGSISPKDVFYLMVDQDGAMELSMPIIHGTQFVGCVERIFLHEGHDADEIVVGDDSPNLDDDIVVEIRRKDQR